jgi:Tol biopolymer transport system component
MRANGGDRRQITTAHGADFAPFTTYDGRFVVFGSNRNGKQNLWRMKSDGSEQTQLTNEDDVSSPSVSPDNRTVFYSSFEKNSPVVLRKVGLEGGESKQLTAHPTFFPQVSPDGKFIACLFSDAAVKAGIVENMKLTILSAETGEIIKQFDKTLDRNNLFPIAWSNNNTITYLTVENGSSNLWEHTLEQKTPRLLLSSPNDTIFRFAWSPDGQKLVYQKCAKINDIVLIGSAEK